MPMGNFLQFRKRTSFIQIKCLHLKSEVGNRYFINSVLLNLIAALPQPFLNKNGSELSLPLLLLHFKKGFDLVLQT